MPDLRQTRKKLKVALAVMAGIDVLALVVYLSPLVGSADSRRQEINQLSTELIAKNTLVAPLQNLPQKVVLASHEISDFYGKRFAANNADVYTELGKLKDANGVTIEQAKYKVGAEGPGGLQPFEIEMDLSGSYTSLAKFINAIERNQMFFIINNVSLGGEQQGPVKLNVKLETFLKAGS